MAVNQNFARALKSKSILMKKKKKKGTNVWGDSAAPKAAG